MESHEKTVAFLRNATAAIYSKEVGCWGDDYGGTRDNYLQGAYQDVLNDVPVMAYPLCSGTISTEENTTYLSNSFICGDAVSSYIYLILFIQFFLLII